MQYYIFGRTCLCLAWITHNSVRQSDKSFVVVLCHCARFHSRQNRVPVILTQSQNALEDLPAIFVDCSYFPTHHSTVLSSLQLSQPLLTVANRALLKGKIKLLKRSQETLDGKPLCSYAQWYASSGAHNRTLRYNSWPVSTAKKTLLSLVCPYLS